MYEWLFAPPGARPDSWDEERAAVALTEAIESDRAEIFVAVESTAPPAAPGREAEEVAAYAGICTVYLDLHSVRYGPRAWVEDLAVDPERRSQGVGKALLTAAREWARQRGASHLELDSADTRPDAHRFYEREGAAYKSISFGWPLQL